MSKNHDNDRPEIHIHPDVVEIGPDGVRPLIAHFHAEEGSTEQDILEAGSEQLDVPIEQLMLSRPEVRASQTGRMIFGFSNWDGCNWVPSGPEGDPNLN